MITTINSNILALQTHRHLAATGSALSTAITRLSSGLRINSARDDAAGMAIANRMETNLRADNRVSRGVNDGISLIQTAEGGLDEINNLLHRARQLAVQAANDALSAEDRVSLNNELATIRDGIDQTATSTQIFGKHPLASEAPAPVPVELGNTQPLSSRFPFSGATGSFSSGIVSTAYIPAGAKNVTLTIDSLGADDDIQLFTRDGKHLVGTPIEAADPADIDRVWTSNLVNSSTVEARVLTEANGFLPNAVYSGADLLEGPAVYDFADPSADATASYNGMTFRYSGDGDRYESKDPMDGNPHKYNDGMNGPDRKERLNISEATEDLLILVVGSGAFDATVTWDEMPTPMVSPPPPPIMSEEVEIVVSANFGEEIETLTIDPAPSDTVTLGIDTVGLDSTDRAHEAIAKLDAALERVNGYRARFGALHNRFDGITQNLAQQRANLSSAKSRILDTDYAQETASLARTQIRQQAAMAVLAQTNQLPQTVLSLLNG